MFNCFPRTIFNRIVILLAVAALLGGCNAGRRLSSIGAEPQVSNIENPVTKQGYKPVALPMPNPRVAKHAPNSLWRPGARAFFKDQRAAELGDILTVAINIDDGAKIDNSTSRSRDNAEDAGLGGLIGVEKLLPKVISEISAADLARLESQSLSTGRGKVDRKEEIELTVAAVITQILPNGNFVITGSQEVVVNYEKRILQVSGVIRPQDIDARNRVQHSQIAEARIVYGGRGIISDVQQPRYGQQIFDVIFPF